MGGWRWALAVWLAMPAAVLAQDEADWQNIGRLRVGQEVQVVDWKLKSFEGRFEGYAPDSISLRSRSGAVSVPRTEVLSVRHRGRSHRARNTLLGLAIGAAAGAAGGAIHGATYHEEGETGVFMLVWTPIGAGIGAGVGAALPAGQVTVYRAKPRNERNGSMSPGGE